ncbi:Sir2 family NAD-dependent protein deacetylase [Pseudomonas chlororaphis]|uniref:Sir2 family NAD-dependent protein deacetylase n=1 Tax=Pseudomonas chlororaphis TaxID=587753 RepID=UPI001179CD14|nr:Sir2 family NAD-dependent protein deacetylase [Pseudomonas chlororaphis]
MDTLEDAAGAGISAESGIPTFRDQLTGFTKLGVIQASVWSHLQAILRAPAQGATLQRDPEIYRLLFLPEQT